MSAERIVRYSAEELRRLAATEDRTDWARLAAEEAAGIEPERDEDEIGMEIDWASARLVIPQPKKAVSVRLDADILDFFKAQGKGYQTRMNAVLRAWMEAQKKGPVSGR